MNKMHEHLNLIMNKVKFDDQIELLYNSRVISRESYRELKKFKKYLFKFEKLDSLLAFLSVSTALSKDILNMMNFVVNGKNIDELLINDNNKSKETHHLENTDNAEWIVNDNLYFDVKPNKLFMSEDLCQFLEEVEKFNNKNNLHNHHPSLFLENYNDNDDDNNSDISILIGFYNDTLVIGTPVAPNTYYKFKFDRYENGAYMNDKSYKYFNKITQGKFINSKMYFNMVPDLPYLMATNITSINIIFGKD